MRPAGWCGILAAFVIAIPLFAQTTVKQTGDEKPTESEHIHGPDGLEGWTLSWPLPDQPNERFPGRLLIARNGRILRQIDGDGLIWKWMFWANGRQVAYESGPLHFSMDCVLYDLAKGREVSRIDCYHELPARVPDWVSVLAQ
jgi:hypothetical protein